MTQDWKSEFDKKFASMYLIADERIIELNHNLLKGFISGLLSEQRLTVLDEVKNSLEKELEKWDESSEELEDGWGNYTVCLPWELKEKKLDISTIINQLKRRL